MAQQISGNSGYLAIRPEVIEGIPVDTPNIFVPFYEKTLIAQTIQSHGTASIA